MGDMKRAKFARIKTRTKNLDLLNDVFAKHGR